jgi:hypothetical protein
VNAQVTANRPARSLAAAPPPPPPQADVAPQWRRPVVLAGVAAAATIYTTVLNPDAPNNHVFPLCPLKWITGWDCPFCGGLRSVHALTHGHVVEAIHHNALFVAAAPFLVAGWALWFARSLGWRHAPRWVWPRWATTAAVVVLAAFMLARNLPYPAVHWMFSSSA